MQLSPTSLQVIRYGAYAGLIPFVAALILLVLPEFNPFGAPLVERALLGYGALILGFLGGVRWGLAIRVERDAARTLLGALLGPVLGLVVLLLPFQPGLALLIVGFGAHGAWDVLSVYQNNVPGAYADLRRQMTIIVCLLLLAIFAGHGLLITP